MLTADKPGVCVNGPNPYCRVRPSRRADVLFRAARLNGRGIPDKPLSEVPKSIRFGGRMVMWAVTNGQPDLAGTCISIEQLLHAASFDSVVVGRLSTDSGEMMVATALFHPVRSHCGLLH